MARLRLDRAVARCFDLTRSQAAAAIREGRVSLAGQVCRVPALQIEPGAGLMLDGRACSAAEGLRRRVFMLNKPAGVVCADRDRCAVTVMELFASEPRPWLLHPAGRLDADVRGLLLITDDGALIHRLTAPRHGIARVYEVTTAAPIPAAAAEDFARGLHHPQERRPYRSAVLEVLAPCRARVCVREGRYHEVKRLFECVGTQVSALRRVQLGALRLDERLQAGEYRRLEEEELEAVFEGAAAMTPPASPAASAAAGVMSDSTTRST